MKSSAIDLGEFQEAVLLALTTIRDEHVRLIDVAPSNEPAMGTIRRLSAYQASRCIAVMHLATAGMAWDAEIVLRSVYDASARMIFLCVADRRGREALDREYWEVLGAIADRKRALKVEVAGAAGGHSDARGDAVFDVFRDPSLFAVAPRGTKSERKAIEQKWSFQEIIGALARNADAKLRGLKQMQAFLHTYGLASHLIHADGVALDLMHDRATRPPNEEALLAATQICRIFTDVVGLRATSAEALRLMLGQEFTDFEIFWRRTWRCFELSAPLMDAFYDTQADFYRRYGRTEFDAAAAPD